MDAFHLVMLDLYNIIAILRWTNRCA